MREWKMYKDYNNNGYNNHSNVRPENIKKRKRVKSGSNFALVWSVTTILICIIISTIILLASSAAKIPVLSSIGAFFKEKIAGNVRISPGLPFIGGRQNILLLGVDSNGNQGDPFKGARSDTLIVLSIDPFSRTANALSIPRDSKVFIANNNGIDKINAAHSIGGPDLTKKTVEHSLGLRIDHYIAVDYSCIKELVNALGGVPVNVEKNMHYTDRSGNLYINLHPGYQVLNSKEAIGYIRFRHDAIGDIGRMKRQQWFVRGVVEKMQDPLVIPKIPQLVQVAAKYLRTDMNLYELTQLASFAKSINLADVQAAQLPGRPSRFGRISYWILDTDKTQNIIDRLIYRNDAIKKDTGITVSVLYTRDMETRAKEAKTLLEQAGYMVNCSSRTKDPHSQIIAHTDYAGISAARKFRSMIPELKSAQMMYSPDSLYCGESDFTLVIAKN